MDVYEAVSDPTRRAVLEALVAGPKPVREIVTLFDLSQPAVSKHLRVLREAGLVETVRLSEDARLRLYRLRPQPLRELQRWLETFWQGRLDEFSEYAREQA
jgi:DNA-binding transcriptional ArsR family regulator